MTRYLFSCDTGDLLVRNPETDANWSLGRPLGAPISECRVVADDLVVILTDPDAVPVVHRNLAAITEDGRIVWRAQLPTGDATDTFVDVELTHEGIVTRSWSGHRLVIDPGSGEVIRSTFVK